MLASHAHNRTRSVRVLRITHAPWLPTFYVLKIHSLPLSYQPHQKHFRHFLLSASRVTGSLYSSLTLRLR